MSGPLIEGRGLHLAREGRTVIAALDLVLDAGERLFVLGPSGAGKTTLLHALLGFVPLAAGTLAVFGEARRCERDFIPLRGPLGLLFQDPGDQLFGPTVAEDVAFGPLNLGLAPAQAAARAEATLAALDIAHLAARPVHALSGGEQRLAALAGVLAMAPRVLLLDEPTNGLDADASARVLAALAQTGLPMVVASHDPACIEALATRVLELPARPSA
ncbi:energy-coupling factor ABC transporter ATP-binding protein [Azoarcus olearius]|uniref:energy-coupling factor ABC transporter ATP-binding protein n=1 Tax=Azoarcus sp. (strain BH72) TaxID=418699 RepID=UPI0005A1AE39|nr:ABC transporter ATP-binding protein [Azoarcus olearius]